MRLLRRGDGPSGRFDLKQALKSGGVFALSGIVIAAISLPPTTTTASPSRGSKGDIAASGAPRNLNGEATDVDSLSSLSSDCSPSPSSSDVTEIYCSFGYSGSGQSITIPEDVSSVSFNLVGAGGGGAQGGDGGDDSGTASVSGGESVTVDVGEAGGGDGNQPDGGWPDGGSAGGGYSDGCGGGGGTSLLVSGTNVAEAGGGGGCGGYGDGASPSSGGSGGESAGGSGGSNHCGGGGGGSGESGGGGGGGGGGTLCVDGSGGGSHNGTSGGGGGGGDSSGGGSGGGGGGGGYVGGGGGGGGGDFESSGGGGGGGSDGYNSSYVSNFSDYPGDGSGPGSSAASDGSADIYWDPATPTVALDVTTPTVAVGHDATLSATVSLGSTGYVPTGTLDFYSSSNTLVCSVQLSGGTGSCSFATTTVGPTDSFYAAYSGDSTASYAQSSDGYVDVTADPTTTDNVSVATGTGSNLTLSTSIVPSGSAGSLSGGSVDFYEKLASASSYTQACSQTIAGGLTAGQTATGVSCSFTSTPGDHYDFTATFVGNTDNATSSTATATTYNVTLDSTSIALATTPTGVTYGDSDVLEATVTGIPSSDTTNVGKVTYEYTTAGNPLVTCTGNGQTNPASVNTSNGVATECTYVPNTTTESVEAVFAGDAQTSTSTSTTKTITVTPAASSTSVSVTPAGGHAYVGVPISISATVTDTSNTGAVPGGVVEFFEGSTVITGCATVTPTSGVATCTSVPTPSALTALSFHAIYCPAGSTGTCPDWVTSTSTTVNYTPTADPTTITLSPTAALVSPISEVAGTTVTVTATVSDTYGAPAPDGTVDFTENGQAIDPTTQTTCSAVAVGAVSNTDTSTATCSFVPPSGTTVSVFATYTSSNSLTTTSTSTTTPLYYVVGGAPTTVTFGLDTTSSSPISLTTIPYGEPVLLEAGVTSSVGGTVDQGTISFGLSSTGGTGTFSPVSSGGSSICQNVAVTNGAAVCSTDYLPSPGSANYFEATYADASGSFSPPTVAPPATQITVDAATTNTSIAADTDPSTSGQVDLTTTVTNSSAGSTADPVGSVTFDEAGTAISACTSLAVVTGSAGSGTSTIVCDTPAPGSAEAFTATFTPTDSTEFSTSTTTTGVTYPNSTTCSSSYDSLWVDENTGTAQNLSFSVDSLGSSADSLTVTGITPLATSSSCSPTTDIDFTQASVSLFGKSVASSTNMSGFIEDATTSSGDPTICLTGGTLSFPTGWKLPTISLNSSDDLCLSIGSVSGTDGSLKAVTSGQLSIPISSLPFGIPDGSITYGLTLSFTDTNSTPALSVELAPTSATGSTPYVEATIDATDVNSSPSVTGTASLYGISFYGGGVITANLSFTGSGSSSVLDASITFPTVGTASAPISRVPGLNLYNLSFTLSYQTGQGAALNFGACAELGSSSSITGAGATSAACGTSSSGLIVALTGSYASNTFSFSLTSSTLTWQPFSSLTVNVSFSGTASFTTAGAVTYDFEAGTPPSNNQAGTPIATWAPTAGTSFGINCLALAYNVTPTCGGTSSGLLPTPTDPTLVVEGSATIGGSGGVTASLVGTIDLKSGLASISLVAPTTINIVPGTGNNPSQLSVTINTLTISGGVGSSLTVNGTASASIPALSSTPINVTISDSTGSLVVSIDGINLSNVGVPLTGFFAYSSTAVTAYDTGDPTFGTVALAAGFNGFAVYTPSSGVQSVLSEAGFTLSAGDTINFSASWDPGSTPTFDASLAAPSGFPFLTLPGGAALTSASLSFSSGQLTLAVAGTIPVPDEAAATISLQITIGTDGSFSGSATASNLTVFGQTVGLTGSISRTAAGVITASISSCQPGANNTCTAGPIAGPFTPFAGVPVQFSDVSLSLGTSGLSVSGTMTVAGTGQLSLSGTLSSLKSWSITVAAAQAQSWTPAPDVTIDAQLTGTVTDTNGQISFGLAASGVNNAPLFTLAISGVTLSVNSISLGNNTPPTGCSVTTAGDLWLAVNGALGISASGFSGSVAANGCFDLTSSSFNLSASFTGLATTALGGNVSIGAPTVTLSESGGKYQVDAAVNITVTMPSGGSLSLVATIAFQPDGGFVVGAETNLSQWLGSTGDTAYLYYASENVSNFSTGDPTLGSINLTQGLDFAMAINVSQSILTALGKVGINLPSGTGLVALCSADFATDTYTLTVSISLGAGAQIFSTGGTTLDLDTGYLQLTVSPSVVQFAVGMTATLNVPSTMSGDPASSVELDGQISISDTSVSVSLSLGDCTGGSNPGWVDAFGVSGLTVKCAAITGGISWAEGIPLPNVGFEGTITSLPSNVANVIGYLNDAPITFAFNFDPILLDLSIGTENSGVPALEPLEDFGQGSLIQIDYASLYVCPEGATIAQTVYPAGFGLGFQAVIDGVSISVLANIGTAPPSINFTGSISQIVLGGLTIGPVSLTIAASPSSFEFQFEGTISLGPGSVQIGPALQVGGSFSATAQVMISSSGLSAFIWGSLSMSIAVYVAQSVCYWEGAIPYPCNFQWESSSSSFTLGKTGFSITSGGVTLEADGYSITFDYNGTVSVSTARYVRGAKPGTAQYDNGPNGPNSQYGRANESGPEAPSSGGIVLADYQKPVSQLDASGSSGSAYTTMTEPPATTVPSSTTVPVSTTVPSSTTVPVSSVLPQPQPPAPAPVNLDLPAGSTTSPTPLLAPGVATLVPNPTSGSTGSSSTSGSSSSSSQTSSGGATSVTPTDLGPETGTWTSTGSLTQARIAPMTQLLGNGDVLVEGGLGSGKGPLSSAEVYDPANGTWTATGSLGMGTVGASSAVLSNGEVLVAGGIGPSGSAVTSAQLYNPKTGAWSSTGSLGTARTYASATLLQNGDVLVAGGLDSSKTPLQSAELYDPTTGKWTSTGALTDARAYAGSALLSDGDVLVAGGTGTSGGLSSAELFDVNSGTWSSAGSLSTAREIASAVTLDDGDVFVVGGGVTADIYDPATGDWSSTDGASTPRILSSAEKLSNGDVLVAGGDSNGQSLSSSEIYVPSTGRWINSGDMPQATSDAGSVVLSNGSVLVVGGANEDSSGATPILKALSASEIYTFDQQTTKPAMGVTPQLGVVHPVAAAAAAASSKTVLWILLGVLVVAVFAGGVFVWRRRRSPAES